MPVSLRHRSLSRDTQRTSYPPPRSPSPPSQTFHPSIILPTPALVESVAGGAHYAGVRVDSDAVLKHRRDSSARKHTELGHHHEPILDDLTELYCGRPTLEIFERSWRKDAVFEVSRDITWAPLFIGTHHCIHRTRFLYAKDLTNMRRA
jgi:hypothetical protein